ncbi:sodium-dependent neutral amino acid transporter B(0)AT3-like [Lineus longissimus]|uniref:sodium-dependent neutral amino acid transporter B(0)AT3-like n=1 Tax=Lineus longissimus TaxID=88925 RepID=UPI002B4DBDF9
MSEENRGGESSDDNSSENADEGGMELSPLNLEGENEGNGGAPRAAWDSKVQFLLSVIGYAVGLGNVWRFPYLCQQNGGGAFLIPYVIMLFAEGIPLFYLELAIGQRLRKGSIGVWDEINPYLGGLGYASAMVSFIVSLYYNVIITWCLYYLFFSFRTVLPWAECPKYVDEFNQTKIVEECDISDSTSYFWYRETLDISDGIEHSDGIKWKILVALTVAWIIVYLCMCRGIKSQGKVVYVTATFPYVVLIIFFGRAMTLKGAGDGLRHMFTPKMHRLLDPQVWLDAATQIFYSLGLAFGGLIAYASYNPPKNNCKRDALMVSVTNCSTSLFASIIIFAVLGFKANLLFDKCEEHNNATITAHLESQWNTSIDIQGHHNNSFDQYVLDFNLTNISKVLHLKTCSLEKNLEHAAEGTGLAFVVFTQAIIEFPGSQFWSVMFFLMLLMLGLGSQFGTLEGVSTSLCDLQLFKWMKRKELTAAFLCIISYLIGFIFTLGSGQYWVKLFDTFAGSFPFMTIAFFEVIGVVYLRGMNKFNKDIEFITGEKPGLYWQITWRFVAPIIMFTVLIASVISKIIVPVTYPVYDKSVGLMKEAPYPWWCGIVITLLVGSSVISIPLVAVLRRFGCMSMDSAKAAVSATGGTTQSTSAIMPDLVDQSIISDDNLTVNYTPRLDNGSLTVTFDDD